MKWKRGGPYGLLKTEVLDENDRCVATVFTKKFKTGPSFSYTKSGRTRTDVEPWPEGEDNLALILAAPELAMMLKEAVDCLEDMVSGEMGWAWEEVVQDARALLAKLKGAQP